MATISLEACSIAVDGDNNSAGAEQQELPELRMFSLQCSCMKLVQAAYTALAAAPQLAVTPAMSSARILGASMDAASLAGVMKHAAALRQSTQGATEATAAGAAAAAAAANSSAGSTSAAAAANGSAGSTSAAAAGSTAADNQGLMYMLAARSCTAQSAACTPLWATCWRGWGPCNRCCLQQTCLLGQSGGSC